ncbi:MAG: hypothetical protein CL489_10340 [Acidobacteria bacterium]|nr:hypothetical protein [Acidobacteriota bacterium]|tara:strand:+ start:13645 stop:13980 length:336 start_codon:yes stop_codon:yes gene_type:complete
MLHKVYVNPTKPVENTDITYMSNIQISTVEGNAYEVLVRLATEIEFSYHEENDIQIHFTKEDSLHVHEDFMRTLLNHCKASCRYYQSNMQIFVGQDLIFSFSKITREYKEF